MIGQLVLAIPGLGKQGRFQRAAKHIIPNPPIPKVAKLAIYQNIKSYIAIILLYHLGN